MTGELHLILGPMFSGKSSELTRMIRRYRAIKKQVLVVNHTFDSRTHNYVQTHDQERIPAVKVSLLAEVLQHSEFKDAEVIAIDEGQFYTDLYPIVLELVNTYHKKVYIASLDGDYLAHSFGDTLRLVSHADTCYKLHSLCYLCHQRAPFTKRLSKSTAIVEVGGKDLYVAACRKHFYSTE